MKTALVARLAALSLVWTTWAHAADIAVTGDAERQPFARAVIAELEQLGFTVRASDGGDGAGDSAVLDLAGDGPMELRDAQGGAARVRTLQTQRGDPLLVAEEVRALLLPLLKARAAARRPPPPPSPSPPAPAAETRAPAPHPRPGALDVKLGAGATFGTSTPGAALFGSVAYYPARLRTARVDFGGALAGLVPLSAERVARAEGEAEVRPLLFGPELVARLWLVPAAYLDAAVGPFAAYTRFTGSAVAPFTSREDGAWTFVPTGRASLGYVIGAFGVALEGRAGAALPAVTVRFAGQEITDWGRPFASAGGAVSWSW
jgi:hypothetical protein